MENSTLVKLIGGIFAVVGGVLLVIFVVIPAIKRRKKEEPSADTSAGMAARKRILESKNPPKAAEPPEMNPPLMKRTAPVHKEPRWLAAFPREYDRFEASSGLKTRQEGTLTRHLQKVETPEASSLSLRKENLLDLLCFHEFTRTPTDLELAFKSFFKGGSVATQVLDSVTEVYFKECDMHWIPVTELAFLYRALRTVMFKDVGDEIDLKDLVHLIHISAILLDGVALSEFPHFLSVLTRLEALAVNNTQIESIDFTGKEPFTKLTALCVYNESGKSPTVTGLVEGLPALTTVYTLGAAEKARWEDLVRPYSSRDSSRVVEVVDLSADLSTDGPVPERSTTGQLLLRMWK